MREAVLTRVEKEPTHTLGILEFGDNKVWTLEPPWKDNTLNESCITPCTYTAIMRKSPRYGWKYCLYDTTPRSYILIHGGNLVRHTLGCILPGLRKGTMKGERAVLNSKVAVSLIQQHFANQPFSLRIKNG